MSVETISINRLTWERFLTMIKNFAHSEVGGKAKWYFAILVIFLFAINGLNVVNSYVGRDFMTAIENRHMSEFLFQALVYVGVFAVSTVVAVFYRFTEESLGLLWRKWLTKRAINRYLENNNYYRLNITGEVANPDERITEDIRAMTVTALSFVLMFLNAGFTVVAFSGVMWSISPTLFIVAVTYAVTGSLLTIRLGRPLVRLNYDQLDREANFRADLIHVREHAESVALLHREALLRTRLLLGLDNLADNFRRIIAVNRNLGFFTTGYNYLIQIIPALIVAPLFIHGKVEFGVITQSAMAFAHLLGAFSLIITQFQTISSFTAVIARLSLLYQSLQPVSPQFGQPIVREQADSKIVYDRLTLKSPLDHHILIQDLSIDIPYGTRVLIVGPSGAAKLAFFRATAGILNLGEGRIVRPANNDILFITERPYLPPGTLRQLLSPKGVDTAPTDDRILPIVGALHLGPVIDRIGGIDVEQDWNHQLSLPEQQLFAVARVLIVGPKFVFLDRISTALDRPQVRHILRMLNQRKITYVTLGEIDDNLRDHDAILELTGDGSWAWKTIRNGRIVDATPAHGE